MVHRDLKIGLVLGLVIVIGIVIKFATNPHLSPQARMMQLNNESDSNLEQPDLMGIKENADSNDLYQDNILSDISYQEQEIPEVNTVVQNEVVKNIVSGSLQETSDEIPERIEPIPESPAIPEIDTGDLNDLDNEEKEIIKAEKFYIVRKNETLSTISRLYYGSANQWQKIVDANPEIKDPNKIKPGMKLIIPD